MTQVVNLRRPVLRVLALAIAVAAAPLPCLAGDSTAPAQPGPKLLASIQKAVAIEAQTVRKAPSARATQSSGGTTSTDLGSRSFFKTPAGIITLLALGAGVGFALYSTSHDRVKSPNVEYGSGQ